MVLLGSYCGPVTGLLMRVPDAGIVPDASSVPESDMITGQRHDYIMPLRFFHPVLGKVFKKIDIEISFHYWYTV